MFDKVIKLHVLTFICKIDLLKFYLSIIVVFKHEGLRSALDQVKLTANDARKNRYVPHYFMVMFDFRFQLWSSADHVNDMQTVSFHHPYCFWSNSADQQMMPWKSPYQSIFQVYVLFSILQNVIAIVAIKIDYKQSLISSKICGEDCNRSKRLSVTCERRCREPLEAQASEDERKEGLQWSHTTFCMRSTLVTE